MADEEKTENNGQQAEKSGGGKKLLIIGLLAGIIVGGGIGAGAFFMLGSSPEEHVEEEVVEHEPEPEKVKELFFVRMEKFTVPLMYKGRVLRYVVMDLNLQVDGNEEKLLVVQSLPIIRDALLRDVSEHTIGSPDNPNVIDFEGFTDRVTRIGNEIMHEKLIKKTLVVEARGY
ncbi:flagellar basal body-associated FliL family protein [Emcibacter nanhaiensis]|uniref:Flagellar basal body-associated FliL family protein n=1 Tax=Emcibacter nanhaiensis TaxID=1505037 RepID=A0A501PRG9_9PROT|nr:flagellar basal body-associated FliL family protein [Emcibacter nanhaiensis]TPD62717.1 flagellar basal body-associated FliL family protein [Emcibacter nanhaiensis]